MFNRLAAVNNGLQWMLTIARPTEPSRYKLSAS
jgi:hypothetical protein